MHNGTVHSTLNPTSARDVRASKGMASGRDGQNLRDLSGKKPLTPRMMENGISGGDQAAEDAARLRAAQAAAAAQREADSAAFLQMQAEKQNAFNAIEWPTAPTPTLNSGTGMTQMHEQPAGYEILNDFNTAGLGGASWGDVADSNQGAMWNNTQNPIQQDMRGRLRSAPIQQDMRGWPDREFGGNTAGNFLPQQDTSMSDIEQWLRDQQAAGVDIGGVNLDGPSQLTRTPEVPAGVDWAGNMGDMAETLPPTGMSWLEAAQWQDGARTNRDNVAGVGGIIGATANATTDEMLRDGMLTGTNPYAPGAAAAAEAGAFNPNVTFSPEAGRTGLGPGTTAHPKQALPAPLPVSRRGGGSGRSAIDYAGLYDMMRGNAQGSFDRAEGYLGDTYGATGDFLNERESSLMSQIQEMELLKQQGVTGAAEKQRDLLNEMALLKQGNLTAQGDLASGQFDSDEARRQQVITDLFNTSTGQIDASELRRLGMLDQLETDRGTQINDQRTSTLGRLSEIEAQRAAETGLVNQRGVDRMGAAKSSLDASQAEAVAAMQARGIDPSRAAAGFADTQANLAAQANAQALMADRFGRAESVGAQDREIAARQGFGDAERSLANALFDQRFSVTDSAATQRDDALMQQLQSNAGLSEQMAALRNAAAMGQLTGSQAINEALVSGLGQTGATEAAGLQAISEGSLGANQDLSNEFADKWFGADSAFRDGTFANEDALGNALGDINVAELEARIGRQESANAAAAAGAKSQQEDDMDWWLAEQQAHLYGGDVVAAYINISKGSSKAGGANVGYFDPAQRALDAIKMEQGIVDLTTAQMDMGMYRELPPDANGNRQFIRSTDARSEEEFNQLTRSLPQPQG